MALGRKTGGRQLGTPNRATTQARLAVAALVDGNTRKLSDWLERVATGIPKIDPLTGAATTEYLVRPNPAKAFELLASLLEFHIPKLTRMQVSAQESDSDSQKESFKTFDQILNRLDQQRQLER